MTSAYSVQLCQPAIATISQKICSSCQQSKSLDYFKRKLPLLDGEVDLGMDRNTQCIDCVYQSHCEKAQQIEQDDQMLSKRILKLVIEARQRSMFDRYAIHELLTLEEAVGQYKKQGGCCAQCGYKFSWLLKSKDALRSTHERERCTLTVEEENLFMPTIDRIDSSDQKRNAYHNNFQFLCRRCNIGKGPWDAATQLQRTIAQLTQRLERAEQALRDNTAADYLLQQKEAELENSKQQVRHLENIITFKEQSVKLLATRKRLHSQHQSNPFIVGNSGNNITESLVNKPTFNVRNDTMVAIMNDSDLLQPSLAQATADSPSSTQSTESLDSHGQTSMTTPQPQQPQRKRQRLEFLGLTDADSTITEPKPNKPLTLGEKMKQMLKTKQQNDRINTQLLKAQEMMAIGRFEPINK